MKPIKTPVFILPRLLRLGALVILCAGGLMYAGWQARHLIIGPELAFGDMPAVVQNGRVIMLSGTAANVTRLYLNGRPIATDEHGAFLEGVVLENGHTTVGIDAYDRYGRAAHWQQDFVYVEDPGVAEGGDGQRVSAL